MPSSSAPIGLSPNQGLGAWGSLVTYLTGSATTCCLAEMSTSQTMFKRWCSCGNLQNIACCISNPIEVCPKICIQSLFLNMSLTKIHQVRLENALHILHAQASCNSKHRLAWKKNAVISPQIHESGGKRNMFETLTDSQNKQNRTYIYIFVYIYNLFIEFYRYLS